MYSLTLSTQIVTETMTVDGTELLEDESLRVFMDMFTYSPEKTLVIKVDWSVYVKFQGPGMPRHGFKFQPTWDGDYVAKVVAGQSRHTVTTDTMRMFYRMHRNRHRHHRPMIHRQYQIRLTMPKPRQRFRHLTIPTHKIQARRLLSGYLIYIRRASVSPKRGRNRK